MKRRPFSSSAFLSISEAGLSSCWFIRLSVTWTTVTCMPRRSRPLAASRPSRPPPMTTAWPPARAASSMVSTSWMSRKPITPGSLWPGTGTMKGVEPVASSRRSYQTSRPDLRAHHAAAAVDVHHRVAGMQRDTVFGIPLPGMYHDVVHALFAGQHRRQQDAVVVAMRLGAEHGDVVQLGRQLEQFLDRAHAGHAVADHDQRLPGGRRVHAPTQTFPSAMRARKVPTECSGASRHSPVRRSKWCL